MLASALSSRSFVVTAELGPPRDPDPELVRAGARAVGDVELGLEQGAAGLEGNRVDVGNVVADDVELRLVDVEPGEAGEECTG